MLSWIKITLMLCLFGFLKEIRPSEPFITDYLIYPWRNITAEEVNRYVFPVGTYSYAAQLVLVFLLTDFLRYKPLIILTGLSGIVVWAMLIWTTSLKHLQILEVFYGTYLATEVAYFTYIYAKVDRKHYLKVTSYTRAAILCGRFVAGSLGQILFSTQAMDVRSLNFISFGTQITATIWAFFLPSVATSLYFHRKPDDTLDIIQRTESINQNVVPHVAENRYRNAFILLWHHFKAAYSNTNVLVWSLWYATGMCAYLQVTAYIQVLWTTIDDSPEIVWNGAVEAVITLLGAGVAILAGYLHSNKFNRIRILIALASLSVAEGLSLLLALQTPYRTVSYVGYMLFCVLYSFTITVASAEVAKHLAEDSFGLIFGINTLIALVLQTILTVAVVSETGWALDIFDQFLVYSILFYILAIVYGIAIVTTVVRSRLWQSSVTISTSNEDNDK